MTAQTGRIVVGIDGSASSLDAYRWALRQAELTNSKVEAVTSWRIPNQYAELVAGSIDWDAQAETLLDDALDAIGTQGDLPVVRSTREGHPAQVLIDASVGADLLVVGSRGHDGFAGMMLGSVSAHVSAHASCPVVVVRHHDA